jgi:hypothetical protein
MHCESMWRRGGTAPLILNLANGWLWSASRLSHFSPEETPQTPIKQDLVSTTAGQDYLGKSKIPYAC